MAESKRGKAPVTRRTVDLSGYPDLVVIYLGMRVNALFGMRTLLGFGPAIEQSQRAAPDGLLRHEMFLWHLIPPHVGIRQYWRDFDSLERWARSQPHKDWWQQFLRNSGGTGFWHETYFMAGGMEAVYDDTPPPLGFMAFAPVQRARGGMFSARRRARRGGTETQPAPVTESQVTESAEAG